MQNNLEALNRYQNRNWLRQNWRPEILKAINARKVARTLTVGNPVPEDTAENTSFWLTLEEKRSIEADINAGKPIMATLAYTKFLSALLPNGLKVEDKKQLLKFSRDIPEYEIHNGAIRANYTGAVAIIADWISQLFGKSVRFLTDTEVKEKIAEHQHFAGYRGADDGRSWFVGDIGYGWVAGDAGNENAPYAWLIRNGFSDSGSGNRRSGLSLFPYFG